MHLIAAYIQNECLNCKKLYLCVRVGLVPISLKPNRDMVALSAVTPRIYTSSEVALATSTVVIVEFTLACKNDVMGINLYAALNGKTIPAVKTKDGAYQVSLVEVREKKKTTTMTTETTT